MVIWNDVGISMIKALFTIQSGFIFVPAPRTLWRPPCRRPSLSFPVWTSREIQASAWPRVCDVRVYKTESTYVAHRHQTCYRRHKCGAYFQRCFRSPEPHATPLHSPTGVEIFVRGRLHSKLPKGNSQVWKFGQFGKASSKNNSI